MTARACLRIMSGLIVLGAMALGATALASYIEQESNPPPPERPTPLPPQYRAPGPHVPELGRYLDRLEVDPPVSYRQLTVYPLRLRGESLPGRWLTLDEAASRGLLMISERGTEGSVPVVTMENRAREEYVLVTAGEVVSGGKQTRTVREDVILAPGQRADVKVFCVEAHRWEGGPGMRSAGFAVPQSIQKEMRKGADQDAVWKEVERTNKDLGVESRTGTIEAGVKSPQVEDELAKACRGIAPLVPRDSVGFILVDRYRGVPVGAEFFGRSDLALALLPKLIGAYAVDFVVAQKVKDESVAPLGVDLGRRFLDEIRRAGSFRSETPGSGAGIRTRGGGLLGDGVSLNDVLVHFAVQTEERFVPKPKPPEPPEPLPPPRPRTPLPFPKLGPQPVPMPSPERPWNGMKPLVE